MYLDEAFGGEYPSGGYYNIFFPVYRDFIQLKKFFRQGFDPITKQICPALNQIPGVANFYFSAAGKNTLNELY